MEIIPLVRYRKCEICKGNGFSQPLIFLPFRPIILPQICWRCGGRGKIKVSEEEFKEMDKVEKEETWKE